MAALFDLSGVDDRTFNHHFECLCKAMAEPPSDGPGKDDIWTPHPSVFLRALVEAFTQLGLKASDALKEEALAWLTGAMHQSGGSHPLLQGHGPHGNGPAGGTGGPTGGFPGGGGGMGAGGAPEAFPIVPSALSWSPAQLVEVRAWLLAKPLAEYSVGDWLLLADYLVHAHFPPGWAEAHGEALATRAGLMAKVEDSHPNADEEVIGNVLAAMPNTLAAAAALTGPMPAAYTAALIFGRERAGENIRNVTDRLRHDMRVVILQGLEEQLGHAAGTSAGPSQALQQKLFDAFGEFNRDWRRIAVTEAGETKNQGFIGLQQPGEFVRRVEQYRGACTFCRNLDGRVFKVVDPGDADKDGAKEVWAGKTNVGRSSAPNKRVNGELVPRLPSELWWAAAGVQHPHCRGTWIATRPPLATSPQKAWNEWLSALGMKAS
jgi:hypothetical protein